MTATALRRGETRPVRILCGLTISVTALLAAAAARYLVAVYRGTPDAYPVVFDRYVFYAVPLFFLVFAVWLDRARPMLSRWGTVAVVGSAVALPFTLPYGELLTGRTWGTNSSSVALVPWGILRSATGSLGAVYAALLVGGLCLAYAFVRSASPTRLALLVVANLVLVNMLAQAGNANVAQRALRLGIGPSDARTWIDRSVPKGSTVDAIWSGTQTRGARGWHTIWESEFFNGSVRRVYNLHEPMQYELPSRDLRVRGVALRLSDGSPLRAEYILTDERTPIRGDVVARNRATGMVVYRVGGPVKLR